jgi:hypothetical protein
LLVPDYRTIGTGHGFSRNTLKTVLSDSFATAVLQPFLRQMPQLWQELGVNCSLTSIGSAVVNWMFDTPNLWLQADADQTWLEAGSLWVVTCLVFPGKNVSLFDPNQRLLNEIVNCTHMTHLLY